MPSSNVPEFRHTRNGSLNIPPPTPRSNGIMNPMSPAQRFEGPRSPPNTSHVPCKFFRQGACQAGNACPFSHDLGAAAETVCKYFTKGNCKFGPKCANIHMLPDGRRISYGKNGGLTIAAPSPVALGARVNLTTYHPPSNSALTNSFLRADAVPPYPATGGYGDERYNTHQLGRQPSMENGLPTIDATYTSNPTSAYGSPREDDTNRFGLGLSPGNPKGLSVLDAPLPASFDSNGISHAARYGPWPASVPSRFPFDTPSASLGAAKDERTSDTLKLLHDSAFGSDHLSPSAISATEINGFGSSPPVETRTQEYFGKKAMHSSLRFTKPRMISSSAPKIDRDWDSEFLFEEDYVPGALANEVLTPAEKARRGSTTNTLRAGDGTDLLVENSTMATKVGSPAAAASPSRWGSFFQRQREEEGSLELGNSFGASSRSLKHASAFGHVGSPLRNSSLANANTGDFGGSGSIERPGSGDRSGNEESLSVLTQQLKKIRIADEGPLSSSPHLHPNMARNPSSGALGAIGAGIIGREREKERGLERHVSSGSIGSSVTGRFTTPIDEEEPAFVFSMDEVDDAQMKARKRASGGAGVASPLSSAWTYSSPATNSMGANGAPNSSSSRNGSATIETVGGR